MNKNKPICPSCHVITIQRRNLSSDFETQYYSCAIYSEIDLKDKTNTKNLKQHSVDLLLIIILVLIFQNCYIYIIGLRKSH